MYAELADFSPNRFFTLPDPGTFSERFSGALRQATVQLQ
jgi:hypothetical protein